MRDHRWIATFVVAALLSGCGGSTKNFDTVKVSGKVYVDDQPHGPGSLSLVPIEPMRPTVSGNVAADGTFTLTTYDEGDGAPPGEYGVTLSGVGDASTDPAAMMAAMSGSGTESISVTIPEGGNENLELRFKSGAAPSTSGGGTLLGQ